MTKNTIVFNCGYLSKEITLNTYLIADSCKPSLVMTSEIFKDRNPGSVILIAKSGSETLEILENNQPDLCVIDFDLPDVDGASLITAIRKSYSGPIFLTAYKDMVVDKAIEDLLFTYNDASVVIKKPIAKEVINEKLTKFLTEHHRIDKRFNSEMDTLLVGKASGRGKRAPKVEGMMVNISLGGACIKVDSLKSLSKEDEFTLTLSIPQIKGRKNPVEDVLLTETKVKGTIAWQNKSGHIGVKFAKLTEIQKKGLISLFRKNDGIQG